MPHPSEARVYMPQLLSQEEPPELPKSDLDPVEFQRQLLIYLIEHQQYMKRLFAKFSPDNMEATQFGLPNGEMDDVHCDRHFAVHFEYTGDGTVDRVLSPSPAGYPIRTFWIRRVATVPNSFAGWADGTTSVSWEVKNQAEDTDAIVGIYPDDNTIIINDKANIDTETYYGICQCEMKKDY